MPAREIVLALAERVVVVVGKVLHAELLISFAGPALIRKKQILGRSVGFVRTVYGFARHVRQGSIRNLSQDAQGIGVLRKTVRIHQAADEFVMAVSGKAIVLEILPIDHLRAQPIQLHHLVPNLRTPPNRVDPRQC